jgi:hypothetical protein
MQHISMAFLYIYFISFRFFCSVSSFFLIYSPAWSSQSDVSYGSADQQSEVSSAGATTERSMVSSPAGTAPPPPWAAPGWEEGDKRHNLSFPESASLSEVVLNINFA